MFFILGGVDYNLKSQRGGTSPSACGSVGCLGVQGFGFRVSFISRRVPTY